MTTPLWLWSIFAAIILVTLTLDLGIFHRENREIGVREALLWSLVWISISLLFDLGIYLYSGSGPAVQFLTGYLIEKSLSVDNIFVFMLIFNYFNVPSKYQHQILFWGIIGAVIMRGVLIVTGITLIHRFQWVIYIFGTFLIVTGIKMIFKREKQIDPDKNPILRLLQRQHFLPVISIYPEGKFFIKRKGIYLTTPLFIVLLIIETSDIMFALDSIPAILSITTDPFIVFSSNIFAILGLRSLYFALAGMMKIFHYLHYGLGIILAFVGVKMMIAEFYEIPVGIALATIAGILLICILLSISFPPGSSDKKLLNRESNN